MVGAIASQPSAGETLLLRHGFRCVREIGVKVEEVLFAVGKQVEAEFIHSASRVNNAVVVLMMVPISPLSVVVAKLPPFITVDHIWKERSWFGKRFSCAVGRVSGRCL